MPGIFGYLTLIKDGITDSRISDITTAIKEEGYSITDLISSSSCVFGKLGLKSAIKGKTIRKKSGIDIIFSGDIYNEDIKDATQYILSLYNNGELGLLKTLNGSFVVAIYDYNKKKLTIANDRYGLKKQFYYYRQDLFCFAPKFRPLTKLCAEKSIKKDAIIDFFLFGYLLGDKTFFKHIHQLPPASILEISKHGMKIIKYWDYEYDNNYVTKPYEELIDELGILWQKAVERRIKKDERVIIPLSGGLDSRAILGAALKCTPRDKITTFTFGEPGSFDFEIGKMVAKKAGVRNISLGVEKENFEEQYNISMDDIEGMIDVTPYFAINGYQEMQKYGDKLFTGTKIDVLLGRHILSSIFSPDMLKKKISSKEDYTKVKKLIFEHQKLISEKEILELFTSHFLMDVDIISSFDRTHRKFEDVTNKKFPNYFAVWDYTNRWNKYIYFAVLRNRSLFEYNTMLDSDLVDFTLKLPPELRLDENLYTQMLLQRYPKLFKLPTKTSLGLRLDSNNISLLLKRARLFSRVKANRLSSRLFKRNIFLDKNKNYIDYDNLLRRDKEYRNYTSKMLKKVAEREYFNKDYIDKMWKMHIHGKGNNSMLFGLLVTFELFMERFVDT